jgi:hypothetical protein
MPPPLGQSLMALMIEAVSMSEMSINLHQTTKHNIPEDSSLLMKVMLRFA